MAFEKLGRKTSGGGEIYYMETTTDGAKVDQSTLAILKHAKPHHRLRDADGNKVPSDAAVKKAGKDFRKQTGIAEESLPDTNG